MDLNPNLARNFFRKCVIKLGKLRHFFHVHSAAVLGIFIWVGQSKAKQIYGRPTEVVYLGIMGMNRAVWVGQERVWVGHGLPGLIARTASAFIAVITVFYSI